MAAITNYTAAGKGMATSSDAPDNRAVGALFERIEEQARRAVAIIKRLRAFVERREMQREPHDIHVLIEEALALALVGPGGRGVRTNLDLVEGALMVNVDCVQIQQVLVNLVRNAIDAMEGLSIREISIGSGLESDGLVKVSVTDRGRGIAPDIGNRLFDSFVTTKDNGLGVGLSISRTIIEAHGGRIWFTPNAAAGAAFHFTVPQA